MSSPWTRALVTAAAVAVVASSCTEAGSGLGASTREQSEGVRGPTSAAPATPPTSSRATPSPTEPSPLVNPDDIVPGGPPPDGIPPIDEPKFVHPAEAKFLAPQEPVLTIDVNGDVRAYPAQILIWHEIVNDRVGGVPITVTYCPLCNSGVAFRRPVVKGQLLDFGTSGKLYLSNLVMYDRQTESLWPQVLGQAVVGPLTGTKLELVPMQMVAWEDWRRAHPDGKVLSRETGQDRPYGENPYVGYDEPASRPHLFEGNPDLRLPPKTRVVGIRVGRKALAFPYDRLAEGRSGGWSTVHAVLGGRPLVVFWKAGTVSAVDDERIRDSRAVGAAGVFDPRMGGRNRKLTFEATPRGILDRETGSRWDVFGRAVDGPLSGRRLNRIISIESFWFDWAAFFPTTDIFGR